MAPQLRIGIVGLGLVAQTAHLPVLKGLAGQFKVTGISDPSLKRRLAAAEMFQTADEFESDTDLIAAGQIDALAILNGAEGHAETAETALKAGLHVMIEKPVTLNLMDLERVIRAQKASGTVAMVGYMRRYASAYEEMQTALKDAGRVKHVLIRDLIGPNEHFVDQTQTIVPGDDVSGEQIAIWQEAGQVQIDAAIGDVAADVVSSYRYLCGLGCHSTAVMRGLFGPPNSVRFAANGHGGRFLTAGFDYVHFNATYEMGVDEVGLFDSHIEVFAENCRLKLTFDTPFIRHLPSVVTQTRSEHNELKTIASRPTLTDPFTEQWREFHACVTEGKNVSSSLEDAREDLELFREIAKRLVQPS